MPRGGWHAYNGVYRPQVVVRSYRDAPLSDAATPPAVAPPPAAVPDAPPDLRTLSETKIANAALICLGERRINDLNEGSKTANILLTRFDDIRDALLRSMTWLFATERAELSASTVAPVFGFTYRYPLPNGCLRLLDVDDRWGFGWRLEGNAVVTNIVSPLQVTYTRRVTDPNQMDSAFRQLLSLAIALELAEVITGDSNKLIYVAQKFDALLDDVRTANGQEEAPIAPELSAWQRLRGDK